MWTIIKYELAESLHKEFNIGYKYADINYAIVNENQVHIDKLRQCNAS